MRTRAGRGEPVTVHLANLAIDGPSGVLWGLDSPQLNANFATINGGDSIAEHVNTEVDVLVLVVSGSGHLTIEGSVTELTADSVALIPRGTRRSIGSTSGMAYYSIHARRDGLSIRPT